MSESGRKGFFLGDWRVSPAEGVLVRGSRVVHLEPKAMQVLAYLASRPGDVVSREQLEENVWRNELVGYGAVTNTVIKLRKALQDDSRKPKFIATVPKVGYQLIAPVVRKDNEDRPALPADAADEPPGKVPSRQPSWGVLGTAVAVAAALIAFGISQLWPRFTDGGSAQPSIAVLPFENLSDDPAQGYLADGITDDIITDLSRLSNVRVIASATSSMYKGTQTSPEEVGAELDVTYVLKGSIRRLADEIRVNAQLTNTETGFNAWAQRFQANVTDLFAVQDEVTQNIVTALAVKMTSQERDRLAQRATDNLKAYDHFQEGQRLYFSESKQSYEQARQEYRKAIELDPNYGRAYGALAVVYAADYVRGWSSAPLEDLNRALVLAQKAVGLDASTPQTHFALSFVHLMRRDYEKAAQAALQSVRIAPSYADGYAVLGLVYMYGGRFEEAIEQTNTGMRLNPYYTLQYLLIRGGSNYMLGNYDAAISALEDAHARNENQLLVNLWLTASYVRAGRTGDAEWLVEQIKILSPTISIREVEKSMPIVGENNKRSLLNDLRKAGLPD